MRSYTETQPIPALRFFFWTALEFKPSLSGRGIEDTLRRRFRSCLETCDFARFVPASGKVERRAEVLVEATELIDALERAW